MSKKVLRCFGKTLSWLLINSFFCLMPLALAAIYCFITPEECKFSFSKFVEQGTLLFFCGALCASAMVDYLMAEKDLKKHISFIIFASPFILLVLITAIFTQLFFSGFNNPNLGNLLILQNIVFLLTFLYVFIVKTVVFIESTN